MKKIKYKILISAIPLVPIFKKYKKFFDTKKYSIDLKKTDQYLTDEFSEKMLAYSPW